MSMTTQKEALMKSDPYLMVHMDMLSKFSTWIDQVCETERGFKLSDLQRIESQIARLSVVDEPSPEALAELARLKDEYKKVWLKRRQSLS